MRLKFKYVTLAAALGTSLLVAVPSADAQWRGRGWHGGWHGGWYGSGWRHHDAWGWGLAGLAAGSLIGAAIASQPYYGYGYPPAYAYAPGYAYGAGYPYGAGYAYGPGYGYSYGLGYAYAPGFAYAPSYTYAYASGIGYCEQRYRSYDPVSGTYLGYDGRRHPCP